MSKSSPFRGAKKRQCGVCRHRVMHVSRVTPASAWLVNGRDTLALGSVIFEVGTLVCRVCVQANPNLRGKVKSVLVSRATRICPQCEGYGRVSSVGAGVKWKGVEPGKVRCECCAGKGRVPC